MVIRIGSSAGLRMFPLAIEPDRRWRLRPRVQALRHERRYGREELGIRTGRRRTGIQSCLQGTSAGMDEAMPYRRSHLLPILLLPFPPPSEWGGSSRSPLPVTDASPASVAL